MSDTGIVCELCKYILCVCLCACARFQETDEGIEELRGPCREADRPAAESHEVSGVHLQIHRAISGPFQPVRFLTFCSGFGRRVIKSNWCFEALRKSPIYAQPWLRRSDLILVVNKQTNKRTAKSKTIFTFNPFVLSIEYLIQSLLLPLYTAW